MGKGMPMPVNVHGPKGDIIVRDADVLVTYVDSAFGWGLRLDRWVCGHEGCRASITPAKQD
jgi:hypothetical protein